MTDYLVLNRNFCSQFGFQLKEFLSFVQQFWLLGQEWQVHEDEPQLFVAPREHIGLCAPPPATEGRRLGESISDEAAEKACAHLTGDLFDNCVFDVQALADLEAAEMHGAF